MVLLFLGVVVFLFPLAAYCLFLAMLNAREQPTMIAGAWDFLGVLLATSGFLLGGGPAILSAFYIGWRSQLSLGRLPGLGGNTWHWWLLVWIAYFTVILGGAVHFLRRRWCVTVIYNVDPAMLDSLLGQVLEQLHLTGFRGAQHWTICAPVSEAQPVPTAALAAKMEATLLPQRAPLTSEAVEPIARVELEPFVSMCHVTLRWSGDTTVRRDIEAELSRQLRQTPAPANPAAGWLLTVSSSLFGLLFLALVGLIFLRIRRP